MPLIVYDLQEVRRLAKKIESAELATHRLHKLVEDGYDERMK